jgi:hypothetical protein
MELVLLGDRASNQKNKPAILRFKMLGKIEKYLAEQN